MTLVYYDTSVKVLESVFCPKNLPWFSSLVESQNGESQQVTRGGAVLGYFGLFDPRHGSDFEWLKVGRVTAGVLDRGAGCSATAFGFGLLFDPPTRGHHG
jgi:hypothetical protein